MDTIGRKVVEIPQNGKCLLLAIKKCLKVDFDINKDEKNIAHKIWQEVKDSVNYYMDFTTQTSTELLTDARRYLSMKKNTYTLEVVDVIVCATANALNINIKIFQEQEGFLKMLAIEPRMTPSPATIYMLFARDLKPQLDPNNTNVHYNAIVTTQSNNSPDFDEGYFDETQVSQELSKYNASHSGETFYLTDELFDFVITKRVPQLPYNIDGIARFEISCEERFWKKRVKDGRYWNTNWSGRQELNGL